MPPFKFAIVIKKFNSLIPYYSPSFPFNKTINNHQTDEAWMDGCTSIIWKGHEFLNKGYLKDGNFKSFLIAI